MIIEIRTGLFLQSASYKAPGKGMMKNSKNIYNSSLCAVENFIGEFLNEYPSEVPEINFGEGKWIKKQICLSV